ncbi:MAG: DNA-binding protein WhiA [Clostridia bacterium]|nr:MAG: DNA-binding protein WhiA [Clostridia bacterium]
MSFSDQVKEELARVLPERKCCQAAELAALLYLDSTLSLGAPGELGLSLTTRNAAVARKFYRLAKSYFSCRPRIRVTKSQRLRPGNTYTVYVPLLEQVQGGLKALGLELGHLRLASPPAGLVSRPCCQRAFLRGAFLGAGSLSKPQSPYHLEVVASQQERLAVVARLMREHGLSPRLTWRKGQHVLYLKEAEQISELLNLMGAPASLLQWENVRVLKEMRNEINRLVNCDAANVAKSVVTGTRQAAKITYLTEHYDLEKLSPRLREVARLRLVYPDFSLQELGQMLEPRASKSAVNHRLRRLESLADALRAEKEAAPPADG